MNRIEILKDTVKFDGNLKAEMLVVLATTLATTFKIEFEEETNITELLEANDGKVFEFEITSEENENGDEETDFQFKETLDRNDTDVFVKVALLLANQMLEYREKQGQS